MCPPSASAIAYSHTDITNCIIRHMIMSCKHMRVLHAFGACDAAKAYFCMQICLSHPTTQTALDTAADVQCCVQWDVAGLGKDVSPVS